MFSQLLAAGTAEFLSRQLLAGINFLHAWLKELSLLCSAQQCRGTPL